MAGVQVGFVDDLERPRRERGFEFRSDDIGDGHKAYVANAAAGSKPDIAARAKRSPALIGWNLNTIVPGGKK